ncbi:MAG: hypothetical protein AB7F28_05010 [Candidatus Margulisiibacteriota bacterium]
MFKKILFCLVLAVLLMGGTRLYSVSKLGPKSLIIEDTGLVYKEGSVGIGTSLPLSTLDVSGNFKAKAIQMDITQYARTTDLLVPTSSTWSQLGNAGVTFNVPVATTVLLVAHVSLGNTAANTTSYWFATRLKINGSEVDGTKRLSGPSYYWNTDCVYFRDFSAGTHNVLIEFTTNLPAANQPSFLSAADYQSIYLQAVPLGKP